MLAAGRLQGRALRAAEGDGHVGALGGGDGGHGLRHRGDAHRPALRALRSSSTRRQVACALAAACSAAATAFAWPASSWESRKFTSPICACASDRALSASAFAADAISWAFAVLVDCADAHPM